MKKIIAAIAALAPTIAFAFEQLPLPNCAPSKDSSTNAEVWAAAKCNTDFLMSKSYNDNQGKIPESISECAGSWDEVQHHHLTQGPQHDSNVMMCTESALHMGIVKSIY
jgi:hypothetical protein